MMHKTQQKGFTLLESLVAIAIFTVGISTAVFVITQSISVGARTKNKIVAANLASEGIEVIRNIRDRNWLNARPWTTGIDALTDACLQWDSDYDTIDGTCTNGANLVFDGSYYSQTTTPAQFSRTITTNVISADELQVTSTVTCGVNCEISLEEYLYNWK